MLSAQKSGDAVLPKQFTVGVLFRRDWSLATLWPPLNPLSGRCPLVVQLFEWPLALPGNHLATCCRPFLLHLPGPFIAALFGPCPLLVTPLSFHAAMNKRRCSVSPLIPSSDILVQYAPLRTCDPGIRNYCLQAVPKQVEENNCTRLPSTWKNDEQIDSYRKMRYCRSKETHIPAET